MDGIVVLPVPARDGGQPRPASPSKAGIAVRYDCRWERTRREDGPDGPTFTLETTDGEYRTQVLVLAVGIARAVDAQATPGIEHARHYAETREASTYAGKRLFIIGKQNSGFELASGLAAWASKIIVASPSPAKTSVQTKSLVGVRARYVQPFEDNFLGLGVSILDASIDAIERVGDGVPGRAQADRQRRADERRCRRGHRRDRASPARCRT